MKKFTLFFVSFVFLLVLPHKGFGETVKIGVQYPLTGKLAKHGQGCLEGAQIAFDEFNSRGGKLKAKMIVVDDESSPQKGVAAVEKLIAREGVIGINGGYGSHIIGPSSETAAQYGVAYLSVGGVSSKLTARGLKNYYRVNNIPGYAKAQLGLIRDVFSGEKKVAIISNSKVATLDIANNIKKMLESEKIPVVFFEKFAAKTTNFDPLLLKVKESGANILIVEGYFPDYVATIRSAKTLGVKLDAYIGAWGVGSPEFIKELGPLSNYIYGTSLWEKGTAPKEARDEEKTFVDLFVKKFGKDPSYLSMLGYIGAKLMLEAAERAFERGKLNREGLLEELRKTDRVTPIGRVAFDEKGDPKYFTCLIIQIRGNDFTVVYPEDRKNADAVYPAVPWM
ncbi:MAG: amino acid ABC transporter substrate-binding protein [Deltaproteobacteria bacterium]|nr:MAG: amino acid ABC transporter substrate-binding protein [Deltaproteobacteria bacterium]